jgi:hypothetical protein
MNRTPQEQERAILDAASSYHCSLASPLGNRKTCLDYVVMPGVVPCAGCCARWLAKKARQEVQELFVAEKGH